MSEQRLNKLCPVVFEVLSFVGPPVNYLKDRTVAEFLSIHNKHHEHHNKHSLMENINLFFLFLSVTLLIEDILLFCTTYQ